MGTEQKLRYSVYVVLLDEYVGTLPQMRRRNPKHDPSKPCIYIGLTPLRVGRRFDFRGATPTTEWRVHQYVRIMPGLYEHLNPMTHERALQKARKLAEDLRAKGFGVANGLCDRLSILQIYSRAGSTPGASTAFQPQRFSLISITSSRVIRSSSRNAASFRPRAQRKEKQ
jgi:hypothetical protein